MSPKQADAESVPPPMSNGNEQNFRRFLELPFEIRQCVFVHFFHRPDGISPPDLLATVGTFSRPPPSVFLPLLFNASQKIAQSSVFPLFVTDSFGRLPPTQARQWTTLIPPPSTFFPPLFKVSKQFAMEAVVPFFEANTWVVSSSLQTKYLWKWVSLSHTHKYLRSITFDPVTQPPKYGPNHVDITFMNTCRNLNSVTVTMLDDPLVMQDQMWDMNPCPVEELIGPTTMKGTLELQNLKFLTFDCQFSNCLPGKRCWNAVKELVRWFGTELLERNQSVEVVARLTNTDGIEVDLYGLAQGQVAQLPSGCIPRG